MSPIGMSSFVMFCPPRSVLSRLFRVGKLPLCGDCGKHLKGPSQGPCRIAHDQLCGWLSAKPLCYRSQFRLDLGRSFKVVRPMISNHSSRRGPFVTILDHDFGLFLAFLLNDAHHGVPVCVNILKHSLHARKSSERNAHAIAKKINFAQLSPQKEKRKTKKKNKTTKRNIILFICCGGSGLLPRPTHTV